MLRSHAKPIGDSFRVFPGQRRRSLCRHAGTIALLLTICGPLYAGSSRNAQPPPAQPEMQIPVAPLGYRPPGPLFLLSRFSFSSLDFIDDRHLLFTFHESQQLLRRAEDARSSDDDQMIRAVVLDLPQGRVSAASEWRMHDHGRYLWPLGHSQFLIRQRDTYSIADPSLELHPFIQSATPVEATEVSPQGHLLVIEREYEEQKPPEKTRSPIPTLGDDPPRSQQTEVDLVDMNSRQIEGKIHVELPIELPASSDGYLDVEEGDDANDYVMEFVPFEGHRITLGTVTSTCKPREDFLNSHALMIASCGPDSSEVYLDAWSTDGQKLWQGRRDGRAIWPTYAVSQDGSRFAIGLLQIAHPINLDDSLVETDVKAQLVQVFDTQSGALLFSTRADPILTAGQNFALSADGRRLAVLCAGEIEIYNVPDAPAGPGAVASAKR